MYGSWRKYTNNNLIANYFLQRVGGGVGVRVVAPAGRVVVEKDDGMWRVTVWGEVG